MEYLWLVPLLLVIAGIWGIATYNRFIRQRNMLREAWSGIDVQLKRRHDLIPNLIEAVKGYSAHERAVQETAAGLRGQALGSQDARERGTAENALTQSIKSLFAVAEAYPELQASANFLAFSRALTEVEDQIQFARRYYNGTARDFNILVESFPSNLIGAMLSYRPAAYFEIELATERNVPEVTM